ncbi:MAG TPA: alpha/beta family hydrolase [Acidobacteriota bacterium]|nr:alpha/beta family hydrolase [Acidobacteriota bacterium]
MKKKTLTWKTADQDCRGILLTPDQPKKLTVILAHGAGASMDTPFMTFFNEAFAKAGYPSFKFNFPYMEAGKKRPDPQPVLVGCYRRAIELVGGDVVIGGKSMGGRIASYVGNDPTVQGLLFLGYPLHPPGRPDQLRDQHLYEITKPMFFASGTRDPFAELALLDRVLRKIGKYVTSYSIPDGGHSFEVPKKSGKSAAEIQQAVVDAALKWLGERRL